MHHHDAEAGVFPHFEKKNYFINILYSLYKLQRVRAIYMFIFSLFVLFFKFKVVYREFS
jgi:hypothetical protein